MITIYMDSFNETAVLIVYMEESKHYSRTA